MYTMYEEADKQALNKKFDLYNEKWTSTLTIQYASSWELCGQFHAMLLEREAT